MGGYIALDQNHKYDLAIIGGGASGLMLAANLDLHDSMSKGVILEKTARLGTKLLMSGGGRCNITHGGSIKSFVDAYGKAGRKLRKCLYRHSNISLAAWLEESGIALADEHGNPVHSSDLDGVGRVFPASMKAADILDLFIRKAKSNGWEIRTKAEVCSISQSDSGNLLIGIARPVSVSGENGEIIEEFSIEVSAAVIATGGITYPKTGSDGSGFDIASELGIEIIEPRSALAPVYPADYPYEELSGISIPDVTVTVSGVPGQKPVRMTGDLLFTHTGFSGPVVLNISRYASAGSRISINYNKAFSQLPKRMQHVIEARAKGPSGDIRTTLLSRILENDEFTVSSVGDNGMVTAGGISLDEIDLSTMKVRLSKARLSKASLSEANVSEADVSEAGHSKEDMFSNAYLSEAVHSKEIKKSCPEKSSNCESDSNVSLYAIGEAIDADGITGGYNLQLCWSTACTARDSLRSELESH